MPYIPVDTAVQLIVGPLIDDTDFKTLETGVAYNAAGMSVDLIKSSISGTPAKTDLTLTTAGSQDWVELGNGMYYVEITAAQNDTEGELQLVGVATGILPFISAKYQVVPVKVFNSLVAGSDNLETDPIMLDGSAGNMDNLATAASNYSATRGLAGTALPAAAADAAGGLPISDLGGLDIDTLNSNVAAILADTGTDGVKLNATQPTGWADNLVQSASQIIKCTVDTATNGHTPTTTEFQADDITEATADHYNGRIVIFTSGALVGQATDITDYAAVGGIGQFTVTALTEAPANNDTFIIV